MGSSFNPQILMEKLAKLNSSQQSIETLSHWCIFHMNKAKQVVETWARQFHCSPREQRLAYLYLANDILQNSRRKGSEFVGEFWKVLPDALRDVMANGDEFGRNSASRLISIWEERKVFGSRGQILKEELLGRQLDNNNRNGKNSGFKLKHSGGDVLEKIVSGYELVYGGSLDEDVILNKSKDAISWVEKVDKEVGGDFGSSGQVNGIVEELKGQNAVLRDCIEQLTAIESSRANLVSHLREALHEQEYKLDQVRKQLQAAQSHSEEADNICRRLVGRSNDVQNKEQTASLSGVSREQTAPVMYTRQVTLAEDPKSAAAAVAAKLTASTSSAQMLTYVLNSFKFEGNPMKEHSGSETKRPKIENDEQSSCYVPASQVPPPPPFPPHPEDLAQPPPPSSPPPLSPLPLPPNQPYPASQFMPTIGIMPYGYRPNQQLQPLQHPAYSPVAPPPPALNGVSLFVPPPAHSYSSENSFYSQPMAPVSRQ